MSKTQPIRQISDIEKMKSYFLERGEIRNYVMIIMGINTSLRISDILSLQWKDVYNFKLNMYRQHIDMVEKKTQKETVIALNHAVIAALNMYQSTLTEFNGATYIFKSRTGNNRPITRNRAFNIIKKANERIGIEGNIACHSLRKTFGYQAWKKGVPPALLMSIYNHSSYEITKRYLGISQDERDCVFFGMNL